MPIPRIFAIALAILALTGYSLGDTTPTSQSAVEPRPLALVALGAPRDLPERTLGASAEPLIEHLLDDLNTGADFPVARCGPFHRRADWKLPLRVAEHSRQKKTVTKQSKARHPC